MMMMIDDGYLESVCLMVLALSHAYAGIGKAYTADAESAVFLDRYDVESRLWNSSEDPCRALTTCTWWPRSVLLPDRTEAMEHVNFTAGVRHAWRTSTKSRSSSPTRRQLILRS